MPEGLRDVQGGDGLAVAIDDGEAALEGELVALEDAVDCGERVGEGWLGCAERKAGELDGDGVGFGAGVGGGVAEELEGHAVGVVAHLRDGLREPAVDRAVHQQVAEGEHEDERDERDEDGSPEHAGAQAGAEDAAALVGVELEDVAHEQDEHADEEQEGKDGERDEDSVWIGEAGLRKLRLKALSVASARKSRSRHTPSVMTSARRRLVPGTHARKFTRSCADGERLR